MPDASVTTRRYRWGGSEEALGGPFDLALASDLTYEPAAHGAPVVYKHAGDGCMRQRHMGTGYCRPQRVVSVPRLQKPRLEAPP